jgi:ABC-type antimicrobial peptide transport system permease subunit
MTLHVRQRAGAAGVPAAVREEIRALDARLPVAEETTLARAISVSLLPQRVASTVTGLFGVLGLLLVGIGVYGVTAFAVSRRTREFGVRVALGARGADVLGLVLRQGVVLASIGIVLGLAGAAAATRLLSSLLFGVSATDPWVFGAAAGVLAGIVVLGSLVPAWRATRIDPLVALRYE